MDLRITSGLFAGIVLAGIGTGTTAHASWEASCMGTGAEQECTVTTAQRFHNNRGGRNQVKVSLKTRGDCVTLHMTFDAPLDIDEPVVARVDGHPPISFYTMSELTELARAIDTEQRPDGVAPELAAFYDTVQAGGLEDGVSPAAELVVRFARVKESYSLGMACAPTTTLLPKLASGGALTIHFQDQQPHDQPTLYHWSGLDARRVTVPLDGLSEALDSIGATATFLAQ